MQIPRQDNFADRLDQAVQATQSRVVVGLDPDWKHIPESLKSQAARSSGDVREGQVWAVREFCERIIEATAQVACAFKPQVAFFEQYGPEGLNALARILVDHREQVFIVDCKRGDIGSTSEAYARAYFNLPGEPPAPFPADCVTHNPYLGKDSLAPYFPYLEAGAGMFLLAKTSNPSAAELQDLMVSGGPEGWPDEALASRVARLAALWGSGLIGRCGFSSLGLVVGATYPETAEALRRIAPQALFLVPGLETQGGKLSDARAFADGQGQGAIFNFSRAIICAYRSEQFAQGGGDEDFALAAQRAAEHYRARLNEALDGRQG